MTSTAVGRTVTCKQMYGLVVMYLVEEDGLAMAGLVLICFGDSRRVSHGALVGLKWRESVGDAA